MDLPFPDTINFGSDSFDDDHGASLSMLTTTGSNDLELPPVNHTANNSSQSSDNSWMDGILSPTAAAPSVSSKKFEIMKFFDSKNITFLSDSNGRITIDSSGSNNDFEILDYCRSRGSVTFSGDKIIIDTNANHGVALTVH